MEEKIRTDLQKYGLNLKQFIPHKELKLSRLFYVCKNNHSNEIGHDAMYKRIKSVSSGKFLHACLICHRNIELENFIRSNTNGFSYTNSFNDKKGRIIFTLKCPKNHEITIPRVNIVSGKCLCIECKKVEIENTTSLLCKCCKTMMDINKFHKKGGRPGRKNRAFYCKNCTKSYQVKWKSENNYKNPSKEEIIVNGISGKYCRNINCGWQPYLNYYKNKACTDGYHSDCKKCVRIFNISIEEYRKNWFKLYKYNKYHTDKKFKMLKIIRGRILDALKKETIKKSEKTIKLLGCTIEEFLEYITPHLKDGMTFENHGKLWHYDHTIPINAFNLNKKIEQLRCFNYKNMKPMFASENLSKGAKYTFTPKLEITLFFEALKRIAPHKLKGLEL